MTRRFWTDADRALLRELYPTTSTDELAARLGRTVKAIWSAAGELGLHKIPAYYWEGHGGRFIGGSGVETRFQAGHAPWNKGANFVAGGRSAETRFPVGHRPHTWLPVGSYRINSYGILDRKVSDRRNGWRDWRPVHRLVWEEAHGPVPPGHVVVFKPDRKTTVLEDITLDAVELVSRSELMARNTVHRYPEELKSAIRQLGWLKRKIKARTRNEKSDD